MQLSGELVIAATVEGVSRLTVGPVHQRKNTTDTQQKNIPLQLRENKETINLFFLSTPEQKNTKVQKPFVMSQM